MMFGSSDGFQGGLFNEFKRLEEDLDELLGRWRMPGSGIRSVARDTFPPVNVGVSPDRVDVYLFAPGLDSGDFEVTVQDNLLSVSGNRGIDTPPEAAFYRRERHDGAFRRVVTLPDDIDPDKVKANYQDGILHIVLSRRESARPRRVEIR